MMTKSDNDLILIQESKQWKDRKEVLDELLSLLSQSPKLATDGDYFELVKALKKVSRNLYSQCNSSHSYPQIISKDSNVPVVLVATKTMTALAKGLRKSFKNHAVGVNIRI